MRSSLMGRWMRRVAAVAGVATVLPLAALATAPASSAATTIPCSTRATTTPFTQWGDRNAYFTLPGGDFESTPSGWKLSGGAKVASGNEPWKVLPGANAKSLLLPKGAGFTTPTFCVNSTEPQFRFMYKSPGVPGSYLVATVKATMGSYSNQLQLWLDGTKPGWQVAPATWIPNVADSGRQAQVTIVFEQKVTTAQWSVDAFEIDPWRSL